MLHCNLPNPAATEQGRDFLLTWGLLWLSGGSGESQQPLSAAQCLGNLVKKTLPSFSSNQEVGFSFTLDCPGSKASTRIQISYFQVQHPDHTAIGAETIRQLRFYPAETSPSHPPQPYNAQSPVVSHSCKKTPM